MSENNTSGSSPEHASPDFGWSASDETRPSAAGSSGYDSSRSHGQSGSGQGGYGENPSAQQPGSSQPSSGQYPYGAGQGGQSSYGGAQHGQSGFGRSQYGQPSQGQTSQGQGQFGAQPGSQPGETQYTPYGTGGVNQSGMHYSASPYVVTEQPRRGLSIASLVLGIASMIGFMVFFLPQIIGVVLGHIGLTREPAGRGMAIAGLVLNYLSLLLMILFIVFVVIVGASIDPNEFSSPSPSFSSNA